VAAYQAERRIRMYDVAGGFRLAKDVHARNLRWTFTDTCLSSAVPSRLSLPIQSPHTVRWEENSAQRALLTKVK
jgi:hypothetical protein